MRNPGRAFVAIILLGAILSLAAIMHRINKREGEKLDRLSSASGRKDQLTAGVPTQRKRIDDFIDQVAEYATLDDAVRALSEPVGTDFDIVFDVGLHTSELSPQMQFAQVLADRRVARIYEMLAAKPVADADRLAASIFDAKLSAHTDGLSQGIADWRDGDGQVRPVPVRLNYHALSAAMFLCAAFCDAPSALEKLQAWQSVIGARVDDVASDPKLRQLEQEVRKYGLP
nr:hypothetical protein [Planctomycetota bacterium]